MGDETNKKNRVIDYDNEPLKNTWSSGLNTTSTTGNGPLEARSGAAGHPTSGNPMPQRTLTAHGTMRGTTSFSELYGPGSELNLDKRDASFIYLIGGKKIHIADKAAGEVTEPSQRAAKIFSIVVIVVFLAPQILLMLVSFSIPILDLIFSVLGY